MDSSFEELGLSQSLLGVVSELGYERPSPIQAGCIPALLAGRDVVGQSETGSGKTAAFALPILERVDLNSRVVQALVLCPTRELANQVTRELRVLGRKLAGFGVVELVGGQPSRVQREALARGVHVVVGTPGRVLAQLSHGSLELSTARTVVLDEADRMLDMGFGDDVGRILSALPEACQTALFSATFPAEVESMAAACQRDALKVAVGECEKAHGDIEEVHLAVGAGEEFYSLCWLLRRFPHESALVFCNFKATVAQVAKALVDGGVSAGRLDGGLDQFHRDQVMARFRNGSVRVLVATDVAGRGLDVEGLDLVVNYELPTQPETYVHRIGRTGRAGKRGTAASLSKGDGDRRIEAVEQLTGGRVAQVDFEDGELPSLAFLLRSLSGRAPMQTVLIYGGRKDRVRAGDILGALTGDAGGLRGADIGKIEVRDRLSYVAVARAHSRDAVARLNRGRIKGKRFRATLVGDELPKISS